MYPGYVLLTVLFQIVSRTKYFTHNVSKLDIIEEINVEHGECYIHIGNEECQSSSKPSCVYLLSLHFISGLLLQETVHSSCCLCLSTKQVIASANRYQRCSQLDVVTVVF